jgi:hypothetical protein
MRYMNDFDIDLAWRKWHEHPVLGPAIKTLSNLKDWADCNSDGWAYWPKPARAAAGLMELIERDGTSRFAGDPDREDATPEEFRRVMRAVKAFRTKHKATFAIVALDYPRCDSFEDYAAWRRQQTGDVTVGDVRAQFPMTDPARLTRYMLQYRTQARRTLCIGAEAFQRESWKEDACDALQDAIDLASDQDQATYLTDDNGKVIAAIVPVDQAERGEVRL